jgi:fucose permease
MYSFLLAIIYIAFISLGLPDSLVGSAWPVMHSELNVPLSYAGMITMTIAAGTICSSLLSNRLTSRLGAGMVTAISVLTTAVALFGFSVAHSFIWLIIWAIPYGLGAGAVDAALNNFVALHYSSRHMNWLHSFWGVGASISPYIMSYSLGHQLGWHHGYRLVSLIQLGLTICLFLSLPAWRRQTQRKTAVEQAAAPPSTKPLPMKQVLQLRGIAFVLLAFFCYSTLEQTVGLWASSYLVQARGVEVTLAAKFASLFFLGITAGRFLSGFISDKVGDRKLIRYGTLIILIGLACLSVPVSLKALPLAGLVIIGLGCAPIYPAIIHSTPTNFGREHSQAVIGVQMACAYLGTTLMPPLFGGLAAFLGISIYPFFLLLFAGLMLFSAEKLNRVVQLSE